MSFLLLVVHAAQHIKSSKSTTLVLVYKYIPFFQHKVYTFFIRGGILSVVRHIVETTLVKNNNNHFTPPPKEGFPKTAYLVALKSCQLRVSFFVCETRHSHGITTQNAQLSPFDLFRFGFVFFSRNA